MLVPWKESYGQPRQYIKKQRHYFANKGLSSQGSGFSSNHLWMWELDYKESWVLKTWCLWTVVLEKTLESSLDCKEIHPVNHKGNQSWNIHWRELMLRLKLQFLGPVVRQTDFLEKTLILGKIEGRRWRGQQKMRWLDGITDSMDMSLNNLRVMGRTGKPGMLQFMGSQRVGHDWATEQQLQQLQYSCLENPMDRGAWQSIYSP